MVSCGITSSPKKVIRFEVYDWYVVSPVNVEGAYLADAIYMVFLAQEYGEAG
jgi:hypothetical protein